MVGVCSVMDNDDADGACSRRWFNQTTKPPERMYTNVTDVVCLKTRVFSHLRKQIYSGAIG